MLCAMRLHAHRHPRGTPPRIGRRAFLGLSAATLLGLRAQDAHAELRPVRRIATAHIGLGPRGVQLLRRLKPYVQPLALCDVDQSRRDAATAHVGPDAVLENDFRALLERSDIEGVVIATPVHWHGIMAIESCLAGKHVLLEAPACRTLRENMELLRVAKTTGRIVQVGIGGAQAAAAQGALGGMAPLRNAVCRGGENPCGGDPLRDGEAPPGLDWDRWLGPLPEMPCNRDRMHGNDRWILGVGGGQVLQQGAMLFEAAAAVGASRLPQRVTVEATGQPNLAGLWDCPRALRAELRFDDTRTITWMQDLDEDALPEAVLDSGERTWTLRGCDDEVHVAPAPEAAVADSLSGAARWVKSVLDYQPDYAALERAVFGATLAILVNLSYRAGRALTWDGKSGRFVDDPYADRLIHEPGRGTWRL